MARNAVRHVRPTLSTRSDSSLLMTEPLTEPSCISLSFGSTDRLLAIFIPSCPFGPGTGRKLVHSKRRISEPCVFMMDACRSRSILMLDRHKMTALRDRSTSSHTSSWSRYCRVHPRWSHNALRAFVPGYIRSTHRIRGRGRAIPIKKKRGRSAPS